MSLARWTKIFPKSGFCHVFIRTSTNDVISNNTTKQSLYVEDQHVDHTSSVVNQKNLDDEDYNACVAATSDEQPIEKLSIDPNADRITTILGWMNNANERDFQKLKNVSHKLAGNIVDLRTSQGSFNSLDDLLQIAGIGEKTLNRICDNILNPKLSDDKQRISKLAGVSSERLKNINSIVSLSIGLKQIGWVHLDRGLRLVDWKVHDLPENVTPTKWDPYTYFHMVDDIIQQLPQSDLFLLEHKRYVQLNNNKSVAQVYIFLRAIESLFYAVLNTRHGGENTDFKAVSIADSITCRHFDLTVGNRRKSGQKPVEAFIKENFDSGGQSEGAVFISTQLAGVYQSANKYQREVLANALLQSLVFYNMHAKSLLDTSF